MKQAYLLIHGIGEQQPMDTLRGFVDVVWTTDKNVQHQFAQPGVYSKPDDFSGSFELRRLTTTKDRNGVITDFYEYYWAHLMEGTNLQHVLSWIKYLMLRSPGSLPRQLRGAWWLLAVLILIACLFFLQTALPEAYRVIPVPKWLTGLLGLIISVGIIPILNNIVGDAARYLSPMPANIKCRQEIRAKGVEVLNKLHQSGQYQRIVVIGHSLGSVIGYDILTYAWPAYAKQSKSGQPHPVLDNLEATIAAWHNGAAFSAIATFQDQQRKLLRELQQNGCPWLVTDFVTLGSPLAHADILLAPDRNSLRKKQSQREWPTCPPVLEQNHFSYPTKQIHRQLHHAAVFGPTRWTNLYFPQRWVVKGDIVGGPHQEVFGKGIRDYPVHTSRWWGLLSHTFYWTKEPKSLGMHINHLRHAININNI